MIDTRLDYEVRLPVFEGPLDLLLHLVQKRELDVTAVSLALVADQYLAYIRALEQTDAEAIADFLVIAAKLLVLKSWALLPSSQSSAEEEEVARDLAAALREYQIFKQAAEELRLQEEAGRRSYPRTARPIVASRPNLERIPVDDLVTALYKCVHGNGARAEVAVLLPSRIYTVSEKVTAIHARLATHPRITFRSLLEEAKSNLEIVVTFMAVLDLLRSGQIEVEQEKLFAEIYLFSLISLSEPAPDQIGGRGRG